MGIGPRRVSNPAGATALWLLAVVPFVAMCFSVALWDHVQPMLLGLPFNLFWLIIWIVLTPLCLWAVYRLEAARRKRDGETQ